MKLNLLDKVISYIDPERGLARSKIRAKSEIARAVYDGASQSRRSQGWRVVSTDANGELRGALTRLRDVARDMVRNNPYAARGVQLIAHNVIGTGIIPTIKCDNAALRKKLEELAKLHFDTTACDAEGKHDLYGLQNLACRTMVEAGEVLIRRRYRRSGDGLPLPFQLQILEPDFIDTSVDGDLSNGNYAVQGVEYDLIGRRVAYHLYNIHPGAIFSYKQNKTSRVAAEDVIHLFRADRPGQVRGASWFAPIVLRLRDFADFTDAQLMRQKVAACWAAFITSEGDAGLDDPNDGSYPVEQFEPGMIERLKPGESVEFGSPPPLNDFASYSMVTLREIAVGLGVSYEALTGDLSQVNFSSGRMGWIEFQRNIDAWRLHTIIPSMLSPIAKWFLEASSLQIGNVSSASVRWTPPRREMIDPTKEVNAAKDAIRSGLSSRSNEQRKLGFDPEELDKEIAEDNKRADKLSIVLDSDGRQSQQGKQTQNGDLNNG